MNVRRNICMFDLENTLIDSWGSGAPLEKKIARINTMLVELQFINGKFDAFGLFSFAINDESEKEQALKLVPSSLGVVIDPAFVVSCEDMMAFRRFESMNLVRWQTIGLLGKDHIFPMWCEDYPDCDFTLFDDALQFERLSIVRQFDDNSTQRIFLKRV